MIKVVIKVIVLRRSMVINRENIIMKRIINQINFKKWMIIVRRIDHLNGQENLSMIGKIKIKSKLELIEQINLLMIGKINILTVGKEAIVVIVTIQMININTKDQHLSISNKIKGMINPTINKSKMPNLTKTNKC